MKIAVRALCLVATLGLLGVVIAVPALAGNRPVVSSLSSHKGVYWGGKRITVHGRNFTHVSKVMFGVKRGKSVHVSSSHTLTVTVPWHAYGTTHVRVVTPTGWSTRTGADRFTFARPTMNSKIQGGLTGRQEQSISARVRRAHHSAHVAARASRWTAAMGVTAMQRARSWLGLPYSWAGGNGRGPSTGVCAHNGGDLDCHIVGFDCSGLTMYAWYPYRHMAHYAATQHSQAGRFHPRVGELMPGDLVFFSAYIPHGIGHVAIYEGNGMVIQAKESGTTIMRSRLTDVIKQSGTYRGATRPTSSGRQGPVPVVSTVTSQLSTKGGYITVTGRNLADARSVAVGSTRVFSFAQRSSTRLVFKAPAHAAGRTSVAVSNTWGTVYRSTTYVSAPTLSALSPTSGQAAGGNAVTLTGKNFVGVTKVAVNTTAARFSVASSTRLTVYPPAHAAGAVHITVYTRSGTSNYRTYVYLAPPPVTTPPPTTSAPPSASASAGTSAPPDSSAPPTASDPSSSSDAPSSDAPSSDAPSSDAPSSSDSSSSDAPTDGSSATTSSVGG